VQTGVRELAGIRDVLIAYTFAGTMTVTHPRPLARAVFAMLTMAALPAAAADLTKQEPVTVTIRLGEVEGQHRFTPDSLTLEAGKLYTPCGWRTPALSPTTSVLPASPMRSIRARW
jgi:hypothetical protein